MEFHVQHGISVTSPTKFNHNSRHILYVYRSRYLIASALFSPCLSGLAVSESQASANHSPCHPPRIDTKVLPLSRIMSGGMFFLFGLVLDLVLLGAQVYFTVMYQDLASDYLNPIDLVNRLNPYILPEAGFHLFFTLLYLVTGNWWTFALNLPLVAYNANKFVKKEWQLDATEIFRTLGKHQKESFFKLGFYVRRLMSRRRRIRCTDSRRCSCSFGVCIK